MVTLTKFICKYSTHFFLFTTACYQVRKPGLLDPTRERISTFTITIATSTHVGGDCDIGGDGGTSVISGNSGVMVPSEPVAVRLDNSLFSLPKHLGCSQNDATIIDMIGYP